MQFELLVLACLGMVLSFNESTLITLFGYTLVPGTPIRCRTYRQHVTIVYMDHGSLSEWTVATVYLVHVGPRALVALTLFGQ